MPMRVDLNKLADLARLELDRDEVERLNRDCRAILDYFEMLRSADKGEVRPAEAPEDAAPLREDRLDSEPLERTPAEMAPAWRDGYFVLPRLPAMDADGKHEADES